MEIINKPTSNFGSREGNPIKYISLHIMAGTLSGTDAWFANPTSGVSAHYGVGYNGEIHQYVQDEKASWANGGVLNSTAKIVQENIKINQNKISLAIECEGFDLAKAPQSQLEAVVGLIRSLATKYSLPIDRYHIIGHREITSAKPTCPSSDNVILDKIVQRCQVGTSDAKQLLSEIEERVAKLKTIL